MPFIYLLVSEERENVCIIYNYSWSLYKGNISPSIIMPSLNPSCLHYLSGRPSRLPIGELQPLPIPENHWDTISVDFIVELPESRGYNVIMAVVDSVGKRSHFIETVTTITAAGAANLYLRHVWKLHGLPRKVISDRGLQFVALFMKELYRLLGIEVASSTTYHLQTNRQTERVNQELNFW